MSCDTHLGIIKLYMCMYQPEHIILYGIIAGSYTSCLYKVIHYNFFIIELAHSYPFSPHLNGSSIVRASHWPENWWS